MRANGAHAVWHHSRGNLNFSRTATGISKWFWVTIEGYLIYILPKFEDFIPTGLGSGALKSMHGFSEYTQYLQIVPLSADNKHYRQIYLLN